MVAQFVERHLARREHERAIARMCHGDGRALFHGVEVSLGDRVEARVVDGRDDHGIAFVDRQGDVDRILLGVERDVKAADAGVRKSAVAVEGADAFEVVVEL